MVCGMGWLTCISISILQWICIDGIDSSEKSWPIGYFEHGRIRVLLRWFAGKRWRGELGMNCFSTTPHANVSQP